MNAVIEGVANKSLLSPLSFEFQLKRAPHVEFFIQAVRTPGLSLPSIPMPSPHLRIPRAGEHIDYDDLSIDFKVDENFQNYLEIHDWLRGLGKPT